MKEAPVDGIAFPLKNVLCGSLLKYRSLVVLLDNSLYNLKWHIWVVSMNITYCIEQK